MNTTMDYDNNEDRIGSDSFAQAPMFTAEQLQAMHRQSQQQNNPGTVQQPYSSMNNNDTTNQYWMQLLQPTPLGSTLQQNQPNANHPPPSSDSMEMQLMLQQLFHNQQNQEGTSTKSQAQVHSLFTLGSSVEPVHRSAPDAEPNSDFFKTMWDEDSALPAMGKPPSFQASKAATKRKWTKTGGKTNSGEAVVLPKTQQQRPHEPFPNPNAPHHFSTPSAQAEQSFAFQLDPMDDSEDFPMQYGARTVRDQSPMSTSSGAGVPPHQEIILPAGYISSSRETSKSVLQQQPANEQEQIHHTEDSNTALISEEDYDFLLPSTLLPPSVMASVLYPGIQTGVSHKGPASSGGGKYRKKKGAKSTRIESPLDALQRILSLQGYGPIRRIPAEDAQYETVPSQLQLASFGTELVKAIHASDTQQLSKLLETGLSPNPCNKFRDSMVDLVCKRANGEIFKCLVNHGCDLRVCDGFGRTPLHHCCWASEFSAVIAETILEIDWLQLFIEDKRGQIPLEYIRPDQAAEWVEFLEDNRQRFFPIGGRSSALLAVRDYRPDNVLPDPHNALPIELASAVSSGRLTPDELANMDPTARAKFR